jgi:hypothetical protein
MRRAFLAAWLGLTVTAHSAASLALNLGVRDSGISIGNSKRWNGIRLNLQDRRVEWVNGLNVTLLGAGGQKLPDVTGVSLGLIYTTAGNVTGVALSPTGTGAETDMTGLALGGLGVGAGNELAGVAMGILGVGAGNDMNGVMFGGLGAGSGRNFNGIGLSLLGVGAGQDVKGIVAAGLGAGAGKNFTGIGFGGLGVGAGERVTGLVVSGIGTGAGLELNGVAVGGVGVGAGTDARGVLLAGVGVSAGRRLTGLSAAGAYIRALQASGVGITAGLLRTSDLSGAGVCGYCRIERRQTGLTIGLINHAVQLNGVQLGVLNYAENNPAGLKLLPLINVHID